MYNALEQPILESHQFCKSGSESEGLLKYDAAMLFAVSGPLRRLVDSLPSAKAVLDGTTKSKSTITVTLASLPCESFSLNTLEAVFIPLHIESMLKNFVLFSAPLLFFTFN